MRMLLGGRTCAGAQGAAPTVSRDLGGDESLIAWLGAAYAVAFGVLLVVLLVVGGRPGDKYGRRLFLVGITGFMVASIACGLAFSPESIILAQLAQGASGALMIPQALGVITSIYPRDQLGKALSAFGPILGLSAVCGTILAGLLIDADLFGLGWRSIFLINIVVAGAVLVAEAALLPEDPVTLTPRSTASEPACSR